MNFTYLVEFTMLGLAGGGAWLMLPMRNRLELLGEGRRKVAKASEKFVQKKRSLREIRERKRREKEIYEAIAYLRNVAAAGMGGRMSGDLVLQKLAERGGTMRPVYARLLSLHRLNKREDAAAYFAGAVGGDLGKDFVRIVLQWDEINPEELTAALLSYQKAMKEMRVTEQKRRDEIVSDLIYMPVVLNILVVFLNFIYVAYFVGQKDAMTGIFF